jgi:hypothetical protein
VSLDPPPRIHDVHPELLAPVLLPVPLLAAPGVLLLLLLPRDHPSDENRPPLLAGLEGEGPFPFPLLGAPTPAPRVAAGACAGELGVLVVLVLLLLVTWGGSQRKALTLSVTWMVNAMGTWTCRESERGHNQV